MRIDFYAEKKAKLRQQLQKEEVVDKHTGKEFFKPQIHKRYDKSKKYNK